MTKTWKSMKSLSLALAAAAMLAAALVPGAAQAQAWPARQPIKLVAVFPPGGSVDQVARILAPVPFSRNLGGDTEFGGRHGEIGDGLVVVPQVLARPAEGLFGTLGAVARLAVDDRLPLGRGDHRREAGSGGECFGHRPGHDGHDRARLPAQRRHRGIEFIGALRRKTRKRVTLTYYPHYPLVSTSSQVGRPTWSIMRRGDGTTGRRDGWSRWCTASGRTPSSWWAARASTCPWRRGC